MKTKEQIYVLVKNEEIRKKAADVLLKHNQNIDPESEGLFNYNDFPCLKFNTDANCWVMSAYKSVRTSINIEMLDKILSQSASELKLTLENIQVDCRELSEEQIKEMADVFQSKRYNVNYRSLDCKHDAHFLHNDTTNCSVYFKDENKTTITYEKFMELFGDRIPDVVKTKEHHVKELIKELPRPVEKSILQEAEEIINGSRAEDYGSVTENFTKIAVGWKEIFADGNFTPRRVAHAMVWLKICRDVNTPKRDNLVDGIGYFGCVEKMDNEAN